MSPDHDPIADGTLTHTPDAAGGPGPGSTIRPADENAVTPTFAVTPTSGTIPANVPVIPGYTIEHELGRGGMGIVYRAVQHGLNRPAALKTILTPESVGPAAIARFLAEAEAVAAVHHASVVEVYECGRHGTVPYLAMEYLPGGSLADRLNADPARHPGEAARLLERIARGVAACHAKGVIHRDLKPANILFAGDGTPKVTDFGIAKRSASDLTATKAQLGTPSYMAPEQATDGAKHVGPAADVWALGVILYECLTGRRPFAGDTIAGTVHNLCHLNPAPPDRVAPGVPRDLGFICMKCLRKTPGDRYPTAAELADDLGRFVRGEPLHARRRELGYRARRAVARWWKPAVAGVAALVVVLAGGWAVSRRPAPPAPATTPTPEDPLVALRRTEVEERVAAILRRPPRPDQSDPHPVERVADMPEPDMGRFRVITDERIVDLRAWRQLPPGPPADVVSYALMHTRQNILKERDSDLFKIEARTTGDDLYLRAVSPGPKTARLTVSESLAPVGGQMMKRKQLAMDIAHIPKDGTFDTHVITTYRDSLQVPGDLWMGVIGYGGSLKCSMLMLFPADRPFREYRLRLAPRRNADPRPYTGPVITFTDPAHEWLYWEIPAPEADVVYRVDWTW